MSRRSALDRILAELRDREPPIRTAEGLPRELQAEFRRLSGQRALEPSRRSTLGRWWPAAVLASAAALALLLLRPESPVHRSPPEPPLAQLDGQPLELGALVVATDHPRRVEHRGRASWELAPGSRARLASSAGNVLRIALEQGSLEAEVQPSAAPESFIVTAAGTEVAVHGTRFRVTLLEGEHVRVAVSQGVVQVRPVAAGSAWRAPGTSLAAGAQADFWAGATEPAAAPAPRALTPPVQLTPEHLHSSAELSPPAHTPPAGGKAAAANPPSRAAAAPRNAAAQRPRSSASAPAQETAAAAPAASVEEALQEVTEHVQGCFRREQQGSSEVGIEVSTTLALGVEPDGTLLSADFEPPLAPAVERCVAAQLAQLRVASSPEGYRVERSIRLRR